MRARIIRVSKHCCFILSLASAADHTINKSIIAYFTSSVFTSVRQSAVQVLPNPQFPRRIVFFLLVSRGVTVHTFVQSRFDTGLLVRYACVPNKYSIYIFFQEIQIINGVLTVFDVA